MKPLSQLTALVGLLSAAACSHGPPQPVMYLHSPRMVPLAMNADRIVKAPIDAPTPTPEARP